MRAFPRRLFLTLGLAVAGCSTVTEGGDDEAGEQPPPVPDSADQDWWHPCKDRLDEAGLAPPVLGLEGATREQVEHCVWAPAVSVSPLIPLLAALLPRPWIHNLPATLSFQHPDSGHDNPFWWERDEISPVLTGLSEESMRSGLIGNFAIWLDGKVPSTHPRPPIVWGNLLVDPAKHVDIAGHYNAYGQPCSTAVNPYQRLGWEIEMAELGVGVTSIHADCQRGLAHYRPVEVSSDYPDTPLTGIHSALATVCLDNGGEYMPEYYNAEEAQWYPGANVTAPARNGLLWLNWAFARPHLQLWFHQAGAQFDEFVVLLEHLELAGWWYWPSGLPPEVQYHYSTWSNTGVCAYDVTLGVSQASSCEWVTTAGCPSHMVPVLPEFDAEVLAEDCNTNGTSHEVTGFCTFAGWAVPPSVSLSSTSAPEFGGLSIAAVEDLGLPNAYVVDLSETTIDDLTALAGAATWIETSSGFSLSGSTPIERLLAALGVDSSDTITGVGHGPNAVLAPTVLDAVAYVDSQFAHGELAMIHLERESGSRRFIYLFPGTSLR